MNCFERRSIRRAALAGIAAAALLACSLLAVAGWRLWSRQGETIAFVSYRDGNREIYRVDVDALVYRPIRITDDSAPDSDPVWAPDGAHLAFVSTRDGDHEIYIATAEGLQIIQVTHNGALDWKPAWSPDGAHVVYESQLGQNFEIYVVDVNFAACTRQAAPCVSDPIRLTYDPAVDSYPTWSPDGKWIAFQSNRKGNFDIFVMPAPGSRDGADSDGSEPVDLTNHPANDWFAEWSPDGAYIAFESDRDQNREIYAIDLRGDSPRPVRLTYSTATDTSARWSPDGRQIAFVSNRNNNEEIYLMSFDGQSATAPINLTHTPVSDRNPIWSLDGQRIAFESYGKDSFGIFVMKPDGSERTQITFSSRGDRQIAWRP